MYIVRDIFHLQFGRYREARKMVDEGIENNLLPRRPGSKVLTDFTGEGYRLMFEVPYNSLAEYEADMNSEMNVEDWQAWYGQFKPLVRFSEREILKEVRREE